MKQYQISKSSLEDMLWMSMRYCIGRHTAAAHCHANTIASIFQNNHDLDYFRENISDDIRAEINRQLRPTIVGGDFFKDYLMEMVKNDPEINLDKFSDLFIWHKLSNYLDKKTHRTLKVEYELNGKLVKGELICYPYILNIQGKYKVVYDKVDELNIDRNRWISEENIKEILP